MNPLSSELFLANIKNKKEAVRLQHWFLRHRLCWSCSSICVAIERELWKIVSKDLALKELGLKKQSKIQIMAAHFKPTKQHTMLTNFIPQSPEGSFGGGTTVHNFIMIDESFVIDCTIGQFTGKREQILFEGIAQWRACFEKCVETENIHIVECTKQDSDVQFNLMTNMIALKKSVTKVVNSKHVDDPDAHCANCLSGPPSSIVKLQRCSQCHDVSYCGVTCQRVAWPQHKLVCVKK
mmetsp:Transcript_10658/g.17781  ORF Transcript_10658/g.17781 Transcript_10658/m.17781 type:complete len:237 (-) Transcript_10658:36-746(-)